MPLKWLILCALALAGASVFYQLGRSVWSPALRQVQSPRTVESVIAGLKNGDISAKYPNLQSIDELILIGLKHERILEVWKRSNGAPPRKLTEFPFTAFSGALGPKLREGDQQIPEGIYRIEYLNPNSSYHLSMKIDYPNAFDREKGKADGREALGFDIFIHGKSVTIGCIAIGDPAIEELFYLVSTVGHQNVEVIIAPFDMRQPENAIPVDGPAWLPELYENIERALIHFLPED